MFGPGEVIYKKGEADSRIYFIVKGMVEIYMETIDQKENKLINTLN
jgi:CRP-like cAMP-binding protein